MKKSVFVSGSSRGLGFEVALEFSKSGYKVILNGRNGAELEQKKLQLAGEGHSTFAQDFLKDDAMKNTKEFFSKNSVVPDVVVHSLGGRLGGDAHPIDIETLHKTMKLNLENAIEINSFLIPKMEEKGGYIVHIGSLAGINANSAPSYAIAKAALHAYIKNSARLYAKKGITIFGVLPGVMGHSGSDWDKKRESEPQKYEARIKKTLLGRFLEPNEIARYITALISVQNSAIAGSIVELSNE